MTNSHKAGSSFITTCESIFYYKEQEKTAGKLLKLQRLHTLL